MTYIWLIIVFKEYLVTDGVCNGSNFSGKFANLKGPHLYFQLGDKNTDFVHVI